MSQKEKITNFYVVYIVVGFLVTSLFPLLAGLSEGNFSILYRITVVVLSLIVSMLHLSTLKYKKIDYYKSFIWFWSIYFIFLLIDLYLLNVQLFYNRTSGEYLSHALGTIVIPCITLILIDVKYLCIRSIFKGIYFTLLVSLFFAILFRKDVGDVVYRNSGGMAIGVLLYGQYGTLLSLLSFFALVVFKNNYKYKLIYLLGFVIGFITIFLSASRSPFVALIVCILIFSFLKNGGRGILVTLILFGFGFIFFEDLMLILAGFFESSFFDRILNATQTENARIRIYKYAIDEFIEKPFFGNAFLIQNRQAVGSYPHNLILEVLMSTGVFGFSFFINLFVKEIKAIKLIFKKKTEYSWICLILIQFLIFSMFSDNIYSNNMLWSMVVLNFICLEKIKKGRIFNEE